MEKTGNKRFFGRIFDLHRMFFECVRQQTGSGQLHPKQGPILGILLQNEGISQADIVRKMNVSAATVAVSMARLEKLGYITRRRNEMNQRENILVLTEEGRAEAVRMQQAMDDVGKIALAGIEHSDKEVIERCVARMIWNLQNKYQCKECKHKHAAHD